MDDYLKITVKEFSKKEKELREELKKTCIKITIEQFKCPLGEEPISIFVKGAVNQSDALLAVSAYGHLFDGKGGVLIVNYDDNKSLQIEKAIVGDEITEFLDRKTGILPVDFLAGDKLHLKDNQLPPVGKNIEGADGYFQYYKDHIEGRTKLLREKMDDLEENFKEFSKEIHGGLEPVAYATMDPLGNVKTSDKKEYRLTIFSDERTSHKSDVTLTLTDVEAEAVMKVVEQWHDNCCIKDATMMLELMEDVKDGTKDGGK